MDKNRSYDKNLFLKIRSNEAGVMEKAGKKKNNMILERSDKINEGTKFIPVDKLINIKGRK